jgi:hypothetical protein
MEAFVERELKLEPPDGFELPPLDGEQLESRVFTSTYYDTPPRSLARAGITLRRRVENGYSRWQLKLPRGGNARAELDAPNGLRPIAADTLRKLRKAAAALDPDPSDDELHAVRIRAVAAGRLIERERELQLARRRGYRGALDTALRRGRKALG